MSEEREFQNETFVKNIEYKGYNVEIWKDDYGQCYFFKFTDRQGKKHEQSCGTYNPNYENDVHDYIDICVYDGTLMENIRKRFNNVRKGGNPYLKSFYESVLAKIQVAEKAPNAKLPLSDEKITSLIIKEVNELKETQSFLKKDDPRFREIDHKLFEAQQYLPKELSEDEVKNIIRELISSGESIKGKLIGATVKKVGNQFDKSKIAGLVEDILNGK